MTTTDDRPTEITAPPPAPLDQRDAAFVLGVLQTVRDVAKARYDEARAIAARDYFRRGDRFTVTDPDTGTEVGAAGMSAPDPIAQVTDRSAFTAHLVHHHGPDVMQEVVIPAEGRTEDIVDVLREHAPHLLDVHLVPREATVAAALAVALEVDPRDDDGGYRQVPGVSVTVPDGVPFTRLTAKGKAHVRARITAGRLDALRALPARPAPIPEPEPADVEDADHVARKLEAS